MPHHSQYLSAFAHHQLSVGVIRVFYGTYRMAVFASPPSAPSLFFARLKAMICYPYQTLTLSTSLLWLGLRPTFAAPMLAGLLFWLIFLPRRHFCPGKQRSAPAVLALRDMTGKAAPICSVPVCHPSAGADWAWWSPLCQAPGNSFCFLLISNDAQTVLIQSLWARAPGSNSHSVLSSFGCLCLRSLNVDFGLSSSTSPHWPSPAISLLLPCWVQARHCSFTSASTDIASPLYLWFLMVSFIEDLSQIFIASGYFSYSFSKMKWRGSK